MAQHSVTTVNRVSPVRRIIIYFFLTTVGAMMAIPFCWMIVTSLKTRDQAFRPTWVPRKNYVSYHNELFEVGKINPVTGKPGLYRVKILHGSRQGEIVDVSTNEITQSPISDKMYSVELENQLGKKSVYDVHLLEKIEPMTYRVEFTDPDYNDRAMQLEVVESDIESKFSPEWGNFKRAIKVSGVFVRSYVNTVVVAVLITLGQVFTCSLAAYAFARLNFRGRDGLFMGYLATMMIPAAVTLVPVFIVLKAMPDILNMIFHTRLFSSSLWIQFSSSAARFYAGKPLGLDSYFALIVPGCFSAYGTFLLRQFFMSLPVDLEDAAKIDGCSLFRIYTNVILPLSKPALATLSIMTFMSAWRSFLWPLVVTSTPTMQTLPVMLQSFMGVTSSQWELLMACNLMVMAPLIAVFLFGQRFFIEGIQLGAVKG